MSNESKRDLSEALKIISDYDEGTKPRSLESEVCCSCEDESVGGLKNL